MCLLFVLLVILIPIAPGAGNPFVLAWYGQTPMGDKRQPVPPVSRRAAAEDDWSLWELVGQAAIALAFVMMLLFSLFTRRPPSVRMYQPLPVKRKTVRSRRRRK